MLQDYRRCAWLRREWLKDVQVNKESRLVGTVVVIVVVVEFASIIEK